MSKLLLTLLVSIATTWGATLTINLDSATIPALPGATVTFSGTISSTYAATVDLNSIAVNIAGNFSSDSSPFYLGPITLAANDTTINFSFFDLTVIDPFGLPYGTYTGTITLLGGVEINNVYDPGVLDILGQGTFSIDVLDPASAAVPEPSTALLILAGSAGFGLYRRRR